MSVEWDGTENGEIVISSPTNPSLSSSRNKTIQVRTTAGSPQIIRTINVVQEAAVYTYEYEIQPSSSAVIAASGGTISYTATLKTYLQGSLLKTESVTPTCRIISGAGFSAASNAVTAASRGTTYSTSQRSAQVAVEFVTEETGQTLSETVTVTQAANNRVVVYGKPTITSFEVDDIPASGGSVSSGAVEYSQSRHYYYDSGQTEELSSLTTGGQVTFGDAVSAGSLGTTVKSRTIVGQLTCQVTMNGQTSVEGDASVYQQENTYQKSDKTFIQEIQIDNYTQTASDPVNLPAKGNASDGSINICFGIKVYAKFTSGVEASLWNDLDYDLSEEIIGDFGPALFVNSINSPDWELDETLVDSFRDGSWGYFIAYYVPENKTDNSGYSWTFVCEDVAAGILEIDEISQAAGVKTYSEITVNLSYPQASAAGGTVNPTLTYSQTWGWNGSTTGGGTITSGASVSYSGTNINASTGVATVASKGTTVSGVTTATTATVTVSMNGKTAEKSAAVQQVANATTITYGNPVVNLTVADIPASGGSVSSGTVTYSQSRTQNYTSGVTSTLSALTTGGQVSYSSAVSGSNLGTTVKSRTQMGTLSATVTMNGKSGSASAAVYQAANVQTQIGVRIEKRSSDSSWVSADEWNAVPAKDSYLYISGYRQYSYTSGSTNEVNFDNLPKDGTFNIDVDWAENYSNAPGKVHVKSRGTTEGAARTGNVSWGLDGFISNTLTFTQVANTATYGTPTISGTAIVSDIPAAGGSVSTASGLSASQTVSFTSGSTRAGSVTLKYSTVSASSLGTTVKSRTKVGTMTATATGEGSKTATKSIDVYQQANSSSDSYNAPVIRRPSVSHNFTKDGGTWASGVSVSQTGTRTYTSGSTTSITGSASFTLSESVSWLTTSGGSITASANTGVSRSATVTISATGSGGKTASSSIGITQDVGLHVSPTSLSFTAAGGTKSITIDTKESWTIE